MHLCKQLVTYACISRHAIMKGLAVVLGQGNVSCNLHRNITCRADLLADRVFLTILWC